MTLDDLYRQYGELLFKLELTQSAINNVKQAIVNAVNAQAAPAAVVTEEVPVAPAAEEAACTE